MNTRNQNENSSIIDFHAHILPKADHGSSSMECSSIQLRQAKAAGVSKIVVTPHFYPQKDSLEKFLYKRSLAISDIWDLSVKLGIEIVIGCELLACVGIDKMSGIENLSFGQRRTLLIEMPDEKDWSVELCRSVLELQNSNGYTVVLAHIDRYKPKYINEFLIHGIKGQVNASGLCKKSHRKQIVRWIDEGYIVALGSDIHGSDTGYSDFSYAVSYLDNSIDSLMLRAASFT